MWLMLLLPVLCGALIVVYTFFHSWNDVRVWRGEFQNAVNTQCGDHDYDIVGGEGRVYLDGYRESYTWEHTDGHICTSNGTTVSCSCAVEDAPIYVLP
jgi:hypothetical protein